MNLSILLLALLVTVNVIAVLCLIVGRQRKPIVASKTTAKAKTKTHAPAFEPSLPTQAPELDPALQALIDEVELSADKPQRPVGEVGLEESLARWRRSGKNGSPPAGSCRLENTA